MSTPSPYASIPVSQRPPNRRATGRKAVPVGVRKAVAARVLAGDTQGVVAREFGVSRDLVKRCVEQARTMDGEAVLVVKRALPDRMVVTAFAANERALEAIQADDAATATKWAFTAKLATESNRWADKVGDGGGTTMLELIQALNGVGGGTVTVTVGADAPAPPPAPPPVDVLDVESERLLTEGT